jgi:hypothetical protein
LPPNLPKPHGADVWKIGKQRGRSGERLRRKGNDKATIITEKYGGKNRSKTGT